MAIYEVLWHRWLNLVDVPPAYTAIYVSHLLYIYVDCILHILSLPDQTIMFFDAAADSSKRCVADRELGGSIELCWNSLRHRHPPPQTHLPLHPSPPLQQNKEH